MKPLWGSFAGFGTQNHLRLTYCL